jgi:hypothetical protein
MRCARETTPVSPANDDVDLPRIKGVGDRLARALHEFQLHAEVSCEPVCRFDVIADERAGGVHERPGHLIREIADTQDPTRLESLSAAPLSAEA